MRFIVVIFTSFSPGTLRKSLQTTSASLYRTQVQATASFLVCSLIFIEYEIEVYPSLF